MTDETPSPAPPPKKPVRTSLMVWFRRMTQKGHDLFYNFVRFFDPQLAMIVRIGWGWHFIALLTLIYMYMFLPGQLEATVVAVGYFTLARIAAYVTTRSMIDKPTELDTNEFPMQFYNLLKAVILVGCLLFFAFRV